MNTNTQTASESRLACVLAPDDFATGIYIAILKVRHEYISCGFFSGIDPNAQPFQVSMMPWDDEPLVVMRVVEYCLPFALVRKPCGEVVTIDTRRYVLAQVSDRFGKTIFAEAKRLRREACRKKNRATKNAES